MARIPPSWNRCLFPKNLIATHGAIYLTLGVQVRDGVSTQNNLIDSFSTRYRQDRPKVARNKALVLAGKGQS